MASSDRSHSRRRLYAQFAVVVVLILFALIKPRIQPWLDQNFPELAANEAPVSPNVATAPGVDLDTVSVTRSVPTGRSVDTVATERRDAAEKTKPTSSPPGMQAAKKGPRSDQRAGASESRESGDEPPPGQLKLIGKNVFRSAAGLVYRPGSQDGHRLKHILKHAKDNLQKPVHGVFEGDRDEILRWIDLAWIRAGKGGKLVRSRQQNDRTAWTVNMQEKIGYTGGQKGQSKRKPPCRYLRLVVEDDGKTVVTAYPVSSF